MPPTYCICDAFADLAADRARCFPRPIADPLGNRTRVLGERTHVADTQTSTGGTTALRNRRAGVNKASTTKNPARCPARACRILLNYPLTIRDSGNASQGKTGPQSPWMAFARA